MTGNLNTAYSMAPFTPPLLDKKTIRSFRCEGALEAMIVPRSDPSTGGGLCGDSLLLQFGRQFFAVADSPDYNPRASGKFLRKVMAWADKISAETAGKPSNETIVQDVDRAVQGLNRLAKTVAATDRTTFTGLFVLNFSGSRKALLLHNGDSLLYHFQLEKRTVIKVSETNHCLIGKFDAIYQVSLFDFEADSRLLLATDGFADILRTLRSRAGGEAEQELLTVLQSSPVDRSLSSMLAACSSDWRQSDDLGMIVLDPNRTGAETETCMIL